jgi:hypothetical protein
MEMVLLPMGLFFSKTNLRNSSFLLATDSSREELHWHARLIAMADNNN